MTGLPFRGVAERLQKVPEALHAEGSEGLFLIFLFRVHVVTGLPLMSGGKLGFFS